MTSSRISIVGALLGASLVAILLWRQSRPQPSAAPLSSMPTSPFRMTIAATGIIESSGRNYSVGVPVSGRITEVFVKENQRVKVGEALFQIDPATQAEVLSAARADVVKARLAVNSQRQQAAAQVAAQEGAEDTAASAKATFDDAQQLASRDKALYEESIIAQRDFITAQKTAEAAKAKWESSKRQIVQTRAQAASAMADVDGDLAALDVAIGNERQQAVILSQLHVTSPVDGTVLQVNTRRGEYLNAIATTPAVIVGETSTLQIRVDIDEVNAARFQPGANAVASLKGDPDRKLPLRFVRVDPYMIPKQNLTGDNSERVDIRVLQVIYAFTPPSFPVYVGQQVDVFIQADQHLNPTSADRSDTETHER